MARRRTNRERAGSGALPPIPLRPPAALKLSPLAAREWRRVARLMRAHGVGTALDVALLAAYCYAYARMIEAENALRREGMTYVDNKGQERRNPLLMAARAAAQDLARYAADLGLSPAARLRVSYDARSDDWQRVFDELDADAY